MVFDAGTLASVFNRLNNLLSKFEGSSTPQLEHVGSARRSSTAGPSDDARLNPLTQVSDSAPQGPDAAPGPSKAMRVPPAPGPSHAFAEESGELPSARVEEDSWEPICAGRLGDSPPEGLRSRLDSVHTKITQHRETSDFVLSRGMTPRSHYYHDVDALHAEYDHLCRVLVESREASASRRCGDSPDDASPAAAPPPPRPDPLSRPATRHSPQPGPSHRDQRFASQDRPRPRDTSSDRSHHRGISEDRSRKRFASSDRSGHRRRFDVHPVPPLMMPTLRDPHHGLLLPIPLLLPGKIGTLMIPPSLPPFGRWWITFSRPFLSLRLLLPIRRRDPSICLPLRAWLMRRFPRVRFCLGPMLFLILSRRRSSDSPVVLRMGRLVTPFQQDRKGIEFAHSGEGTESEPRCFGLTSEQGSQ